MVDTRFLRDSLAPLGTDRVARVHERWTEQNERCKRWTEQERVNAQWWLCS